MVAGCSRKHEARGYCKPHYKRMRRRGHAGTTAVGERAARRVCAVACCDRVARTRGWCDGHYQRARKYGTAGDLPVMAKAPRGSGGRWVDHHGYVIITAGGRGGRRISEHRLVMERALGRELETRESVHHRNGIRTDNRIENLELWSSAHPAGQRVSDLVAFAREVLAKYESEVV